LDQAFLHGDFDTEAAELAAGLHLHVAEALRIHVAGMGIEAGQHAVDRGFDQLAVVGLLDVIGAHPFEHVAEKAELAIGVVGCRRLGTRAVEQDAGLGYHQSRGYACRRAQEYQGSFAHHPRTFWPSVAAHQGPGSTGIPSLRNSTYNTGWVEPPVSTPANPPPITATGSPATTNYPRSTDIRSIPASST